MSRKSILALAAVLAVVVAAVFAAPALAAPPAAAQSPVAAPERAVDRRVALTFDDVPVTGLEPCTPARVRDVTGQLLDTLDRHGVRAMAFVVRDRSCGSGPAELLRETVERWASAGHDLGNHTASHRDFNGMPLEEYVADIARGAEAVDPVARRHGQRQRYFRPPLLHMGDTEAKRSGLGRYLEEADYELGVVTMDNQEWVYDRAYRRALSRADGMLADRVVAAYLSHLENVYEYYEALSRDFLGREIPHVLLLHANLINAHHLDAVIDGLRESGYRFVPVSEALSDPAYDLPDGYVGPQGLSWLQRWALTAGHDVPPEPREAEWVSRIAWERDLGPDPYAPGVLSTDESEEFPSFTPTGDTLYISRGFREVLRAIRGPDGWSGWVPAPFGSDYRDRAAEVSPDGRTLYLTSSRPGPGETREPDDRNHDIWRLPRLPNSGWGDPERLPSSVNTDSAEYHPSVARDGTLYFVGWSRPDGYGRSDVYKAEPRGDGYLPAINLGPVINGPGSDADVFVDPDERFLLIVSTDRADSMGGDDIYVSFPTGDGWTAPRNLGPPVNSFSYEYGPTVSPDGRWLYFTSHRRGSGDLYRVPLDSVLPELGRADR